MPVRLPSAMDAPMVRGMEDANKSFGEQGGPYCQFAKRDLDKMSWLAPVFNNAFGDLLNLELRHEHLFFIEGDQITAEIGYSEKGRRFSEAEYGKEIRTLEDLKAQGYWLVGRRYDPEVMRDALDGLDDGSYYSLFSNQCQDWADRLRRRAERISRERGLAAGKKRGQGQKRVPPTEPASVGMGFASCLMGAAAVATPYVAGKWFSLVMGLVFLAMGGSHIVYAWRGRDARAGSPIVAFGLLFLVAGALVLANRQTAVVAGSLLIAGFLGFQGVMKVALALLSRPLRNWLPALAEGLLMIALTAAFYLRWPHSSERWLGALVGLGLVSGGISTIYLSLRTRRED